MGISGRIAGFFVGSRLTPLVALVAALLGVFAAVVTPREEEPQINVTMANVLIPFPGASAKDVESLVATPAEQVLGQITGVEHIFSMSKPGLAVLSQQVGQAPAVGRLVDDLLVAAVAQFACDPAQEVGVAVVPARGERVREIDEPHATASCRRAA